MERMANGRSGPIPVDGRQAFHVSRVARCAVEQLM
jgi:hypothetical protein